MKKNPMISTLPAPPSPEERLRKALNTLNSLNAEYDVRWRGCQYCRTIVKTIGEQ